jgi:hypothetical protein
MMGCSYLGGWHCLVAAYGNNLEQPEISTEQTRELPVNRPTLKLTATECGGWTEAILDTSFEEFAFYEIG